MNTSNYLAMKDQYSERTRGAKNVIDQSFPIVQKALHELLENFSGNHFTFADLGAADGGTSLDLIKKVLQMVRKVYPELPLHVNYSDLPENDFNAVVRNTRNTDGNQGGLLGHFSDLSISMSPISFYDRVIAPNSVSMNYSATAMHWLPYAPTRISDHVHVAASKDSEAKKHYKELARNALLTILKQRTRELIPGGYFILVNFGINNKGEYLGNTDTVDTHMFDMFHSTLLEMSEAGIITGDELQDINFPQYYRNAHDYKEIIQSPELKDKLRLVEIEEMKTVCPYREQYLVSGDDKTFVQSYPGTLQTWSYPVFYSGLNNNRPKSERKTIVDSFYARLEQQIRKNPGLHGMDYVHHVACFQKVRP